MSISAETKTCMVIGDPIEHSLSPQMHNVGYHFLGLADKYVYLRRRVRPDELAGYITEARATRVHGISCTIPHKVEIIQYLDKVDDTANKVGAVNTVVNEDGKLIGYNTDWLGAVIALEKITSLNNKRVALIGAGGVARAIAFGIVGQGAEVAIFNRSLYKAQILAEELGAKAYSFDDLHQITHMDVVINATPVGMHPHENISPIPQELITDKQIVFDAIYTPYETQFLQNAKAQGAAIIRGLELFLQQGVAQFKLFTKHDAPEQVMKNVLLEYFSQPKE